VTGRESELGELVQQVMRPLRQHLLESGFDGLVWQAGLGDPVAASNFLLGDPGSDPSPASGAAERQCVWFDLESGVPALFSLNPLALFRFYLPRSFAHGGALFDDVETTTLRAYLGEHGSDIETRLGADALAELL